MEFFRVEINIYDSSPIKAASSETFYDADKEMDGGDDRISYKGWKDTIWCVGWDNKLKTCKKVISIK